MKINNIQNNNRPSFGAKIINSSSLKQTIKYAKTNFNIDEKNELYNALSTIFNDNEMKTFKIKVNKDSLTKKLLDKYKIEVNGRAVNYATYEMDKSLPPERNCFNALKNFIKKYYNKEVYENLSKVKIKALENFKNITAPDKTAIKSINNELDIKTDIIMMQSRAGYNCE